eukprot:CAMPEP_0176317312 /NCGR_PEP_ID=MMETSP0121_2-20121125/69177_1 /TAXON_ID=160619 /ORGANISM="Kryptoperidinium foliaceum, Strain CCMP 1326" /LENGTH=49 /DNA_ID= /DNA_START= /DNA_END= /DNA_ORIENTATION=
MPPRAIAQELSALPLLPPWEGEGRVRNLQRVPAWGSQAALRAVPGPEKR